MIKKVVIFAAGRGTRMKHLAKTKPKHLIKVMNRPFLHYLLTNLTKVGFEEIIMVTGHLSEMMEIFVVENKHQFPNFKTINQFDLFGDDKYGTLMPLKAAEQFIKNENFIALMGDNLYSLEDLQKFIKLDDNYHYIGGLSVANPHLYGTLVTDENNSLIRIDEKNPQPISNVINSGLYKFTPEIYNVVDKVKLSPRGEYEITDALTLAAKKEQVKILPLDNFWLDFGKPEDIQKMENLINKNNLHSFYGLEK